jgi:hypothetical protein
MTLPPPFRNLPGRRPISLLLAVTLMTAGCRKPEIHTYTAPKDVDAPREAPAPPEPEAGNSELIGEMPALKWSLPDGWKDLGPDRMSAARFTAPNDVSVMITPLALMAGQEASLVNMWRQMTEQAPLSDEDAAKALTPVDLAGGKGMQFEVIGKRETGDVKVVTAFLHRDKKSWFFKIQGTPAAVDAQKDAFNGFLKSIKFEAPAPGPAPTPTLPPTPTPPPSTTPVVVPGTPPSSWTAQTPGPLQAAKFKVGDNAEVAVSVFANDTGGVASNVSRWRGQLGLPVADEATIKSSIKPIPGAPEGSVMVDLENAGKTLAGAIVPRDGKWYFYKLTGETAAVAAAREAFITYCKAGS